MKIEFTRQPAAVAVMTSAPGGTAGHAYSCTPLRAPPSGSGTVCRHHGSAARALWPECRMVYPRDHVHDRCDTREETAPRARVLPGTAPRVVAHSQVDVRAACA